MKINFYCILFLAALPHLVFGQEHQIILVGNVIVDTPIQNQETFGRIRSTLVQSFHYMGCSNLRVRQSFRSSAKSSEDELLFVTEVEKILSYCYMNRLELDQTSEVDQQKIKKFREKYRINFVTFGQLSYDPISFQQEYRLRFALMEAESWNVILEHTFTFSRYEIIKQDLVRNKISEFLLKESEKINCKPKVYEDYWGVVNDSMPKQITSPSSKIPPTSPRPLTTTPTSNNEVENLEKALRQFVWLEWLYPIDRDIKRIHDKYKQNSVLYKKYLAQKVLFFQDQYNAMLEENIGQEKLPKTLFDTLNTLIETLKELVPLTEDAEKKQFLQRMLDEYVNQQLKITNKNNRR
jgi:hypothetical protein